MTDLSLGLSGRRTPAESATVCEAWQRPDRRRLLQLGLATIWLLDGVLQLQAAFFVSDFGKTMIRSTAAGNPTIVATPITWSSKIITHNPGWTNAIFAAIQIGLGLAIAVRRTTKVGLAASVVWSLGVWWIGEGLGGVLSGNANAATGAPGAVILYALLAVLLWPTERPYDSSRCEASRVVGQRAANLLWLVLWGSLAYFAVAGANRSADALRDLISAEGSGEPGWLQWLDKNAAATVAHQGVTVTVILAVLCAVIAVGVYLPRLGSDAIVGLAILVAAAIWVIGENLGAVFTNGATDVNSGPLLMLVALAYWKPLPASIPAVAEAEGA
jgi:hypothetical protein